ncbi:MAG: glutamate formimidoyltransferase [Candidatus Obscuribacterales bacterium]|nr:glutamate formimidoyltransferase [Candidatus Obscuribacterales bacterium]
MKLVECVPNFSEGRNQKVLDAIAEAIQGVDGVRLLDVDPGASTNRTVMTFVGGPESVLEAAYQGIAKAQTLIDMRQHQGAHPRIGATDVCPFIPVSGVSMDDCIELANKLGSRVGKDLGIPVYLYAEAAKSADRQNLADVRRGEYEGLSERMGNGFKPDYGPSNFNAAAGATVIGARQFLIAYNVNLNTRSVKLANEIAFSIREAGRAKRDENGNIVKNADGSNVMVPGSLAAVKAVGWYIDEYEQAQVSINLIDYRVTSLHQVFDEVVQVAEKLGVRVTGSEIVGLTPLAPILAAGKYYLEKQGVSSGVPESVLVATAVKSLGLSDISKFDPKEKIIEYRVEQSGKLLRNLSLADFADSISLDTPAPGGGSVAALMGGLSAGLTSMVANLTFGKKGFESQQNAMNEIAVAAQTIKSRLINLVDEDTQAFNACMSARRLPKATNEQKVEREKAIERANKKATLVPYAAMEKSIEALELAFMVAENGNPNSLSDAGVAIVSAGAAAEGAYMNVLINLPGIEDKQFCKAIRENADALINHARGKVDSGRQVVLAKLGG